MNTSDTTTLSSAALTESDLRSQRLARKLQTELYRSRPRRPLATAKIVKLEGDKYRLTNGMLVKKTTAAKLGLEWSYEAIAAAHQATKSRREEQPKSGLKRFLKSLNPFKRS